MRNTTIALLLLIYGVIGVGVGFSLGYVYGVCDTILLLIQDDNEQGEQVGLDPLVRVTGEQVGLARFLQG
jgi:hypothetical protein